MVDVKKVSFYVTGILGNWVTSEIPESPFFPDIVYSENPGGVTGPVRFRDEYFTTELSPFTLNFLLDPFDMFRNDIVEGTEPELQNTRCRIYIPFSRLYEFEMHVEPPIAVISGTSTTSPDLGLRIFINTYYYSPFNLDFPFGQERVGLGASAVSDGSYFNRVKSSAYVKFQRYFYAGDYLEFNVNYLPEPNRSTLGFPRATIILKELGDI